MAIAYTVKRSKVTGQAHAVFNCPGCGVQLTTPIAKAGDEDTCPDCGAIFTAPGVPERLASEREAGERETLSVPEANRGESASPPPTPERDARAASKNVKRSWTKPIETRRFAGGIVIAAAWSIGVIGLFAVGGGIVVVIDEILNASHTASIQRSDRALEREAFLNESRFGSATQPPLAHYQDGAGGALPSILIGMGMLVVAGLLRLAVFAESHLHTIAQAAKASGKHPATPNAPRSDT